jgi:hypothetical protein
MEREAIFLGVFYDLIASILFVLVAYFLLRRGRNKKAAWVVISCLALVILMPPIAVIVLEELRLDPRGPWGRSYQNLKYSALGLCKRLTPF